MKRAFRPRSLAVFLLLACVLPIAAPAFAADAEVLKKASTSSDMEWLRETLESVKNADANEETTWLLLKSYFRYFDELSEREKKEDDRAWAADQMYEFAETARKAHPKSAPVRYWSAMAGLGYLQTYKMKALFVAGDVMDEMEVVRKMDPEIDDWGPDRVLGILYYSLPGWPLSRGDNDKALEHIAKAAKNAPDRAVNRIYHARALLKDDQVEKAKKEIAFLQKGEWWVSSPHWRKISERQIQELAEQAKDE